MTLLAAQVILRVHPGKKLVDEWCEHGLTVLQPSGWRKFAPGLIELVELAHAQEPLSSYGESGNGSFPKASARVTPTGDLDGRRSTIFDGITAEQCIVDGVGISLDVAGESTEHLAHGSAGVLRLKLEKDVLLVGQNDKEVTLPAGLPPPVRKWLRADRDSGGVGGKAERILASIVDTGLHDGTDASPDVFGRAGHRAAVELDAIGLELLFLPEERQAKTKLLNDDVSEHAGRQQPAANQQGRQGCSDDGDALAVLLAHCRAIR